MAIFTNMSEAKSVSSAFDKYTNGITKLNIASAFFTYSDILEKLAKKEVQINLVVRLSPTTKADALSALMKYDNVCIKYYTDKLFHPKLYIFGNKIALLGSANMTQSGFHNNQEICITVDSSNEEFKELASIFDSYWDKAEALDKSDIEKYQKIFSEHSDKTPTNTIEKAIQDCFGKISYQSGITTSSQNKSISSSSKNDLGIQYHIVNTNMKYGDTYQKHMLSKQRASTFSSDPKHRAGGWKYLMENVKKGDVVFLYQKNVGVIAFGEASSNYKKADWDGEKDEEYYVDLSPFYNIEENPMHYKTLEEYYCIPKTALVTIRQKGVGEKIYQAL